MLVSVRSLSVTSSSCRPVMMMLMCAAEGGRHLDTSGAVVWHHSVHCCRPLLDQKQIVCLSVSLPLSLCVSCLLR